MLRTKRGFMQIVSIYVNCHGVTKIVTRDRDHHRHRRQYNTYTETELEALCEKQPKPRR